MGVEQKHASDRTQQGNGHQQGSEKSAEWKQLIEGLNEDLSHEYQAILTYVHYAAKLTGPYRNELRTLFKQEIADELGHAQFLADKIAALGGQPTTQPAQVPEADTPRDMLVRVLELEREAIAGYKKRVEQAEAYGDLGLKVQLENHVSDETSHKEEVERTLTGWERK